MSTVGDGYLFFGLLEQCNFWPVLRKDNTIRLPCFVILWIDANRDVIVTYKFNWSFGLLKLNPDTFSKGVVVHRSKSACIISLKELFSQ
jgi:hypothetical protein